MNSLKEINWQDLLTVNSEWIERHLRLQEKIEQNKLVVRFYTIQFSGTECELTSLIKFWANSIVRYVYDAEQIKEFQKDGSEPFREAMNYFGDTNPDRDGKYGELILYLFTEGVLKTPMVTHKLRLLSNRNDQVKGGDGIFFGKYCTELAILIGESKIWEKFGEALDSCFDSLNRFHANYNSDNLDFELFVARSNFSRNFNKEQLDELFESFKPGTEAYQSKNKVHPVLIICEEKHISKIEKNARNKQEAESLMADWLRCRISTMLPSIEKSLTKHENISKVYVDFFILPVENVSNLRHSLYKAIHGVKYGNQRSNPTGGVV